MEPIIYYMIIAISFALASLFTVHIKSLRRDMPNFWTCLGFGSLYWLGISTLLFPFILSAMIKDWEAFTEGYRSGLEELDEE